MFFRTGATYIRSSLRVLEILTFTIKEDVRIKIKQKFDMVVFRQMPRWNHKKARIEQSGNCAHEYKKNCQNGSIEYPLLFIL